jgi:transposase
VNEDRLYRALDTLLPHKKALEKLLKEKLGELFDLDYDLLLYDLTSTYFEGQAEGNPQAQRGYSRDHRADCKQVNIALVVSRCGMPLGYEVFAGNRHDATTLEEIVAHHSHIQLFILTLSVAKCSCMRNVSDSFSYIDTTDQFKYAIYALYENA